MKVLDRPIGDDPDSLILDCEHFVDWALADSIFHASEEGYSFYNLPENRELSCNSEETRIFALDTAAQGFYCYVSPEDGSTNLSSDTLIFATKNIIMVWKSIGNDSVSFVRLYQVLPRAVLWGSAFVRFVDVFPDGSYLIDVMSTSHNGDDGWQNVEIFFRLTKALELSQIVRFVGGNALVDEVPDIRYARSQKYRIVVNSNFRHELPSEPNFGYNYRFMDLVLDSTHAKVVDLWDLAKEKFHIDTTKY